MCTRVWPGCTHTHTCTHRERKTHANWKREKGWSETSKRSTSRFEHTRRRLNRSGLLSRLLLQGSVSALLLLRKLRMLPYTLPFSLAHRVRLPLFHWLLCWLLSCNHICKVLVQSFFCETSGSVQSATVRSGSAENANPRAFGRIGPEIKVLVCVLSLAPLKVPQDDWSSSISVYRSD